MIQDFETFVNEAKGVALITVEMTISDFFTKYYDCNTEEDFHDGVSYMMKPEWEGDEKKCIDYINKYGNKKIKVTLNRFNSNGQCECLIDKLPEGINTGYDTIDMTADEFIGKLEAVGVKYKVK